jgi:hypothetical protein
MVTALLDGSKTMTRRIVKFPLIDRYGTGCEIAGNEINSCLEQGLEICPHPVKSEIWCKETWQTDPAGKWGECYRATGHNPLCKLHQHLWRPSIFMPRKFSRITLEVTAVKVERLQDISEEDAEREGAMTWWNSLSRHDQEKVYGGGRGPIGAFQDLWFTIHGKGSWEQNPWLWVYQFWRVKP